MIFDRQTFYIKETVLAECLDLTLEDFDKTVTILASSPNQTIQEFVHFVVLGHIRSEPIRSFSREGAIAIANFLESSGRINSSSLKKILNLIEQYRIKQIDKTVCEAIYENSSSLNFSRKRYWLSQKDVLKIFKIDGNQLNTAFKSIQGSDTPMIDREDFEDRETIRYFSLSGLAKFSRELALRLRKSEKKEYCERVRKVARPVLEFLAFAPSPSEKEIKTAMRFVKNRHGCCQITGITPGYKDGTTKLVGHHLYDQKNYGFLSADTDNIITISEQIHQEFHQWNGGNDKSCTVNDFIEYIESWYPEKHQQILMLYHRREILSLKLSQLQRALSESPE